LLDDRKIRSRIRTSDKRIRGAQNTRILRILIRNTAGQGSRTGRRAKTGDWRRRGVRGKESGGKESRKKMW
jgi:hypothetical protein